MRLNKRILFCLYKEISIRIRGLITIKETDTTEEQCSSPDFVWVIHTDDMDQSDTEMIIENLQR